MDEKRFNNWTDIPNMKDHIRILEERVDFMRERLANADRAQPEQEPYGYLKLNTGRFFNEVEGLNPMKDKRYLPLYTTPPQRKPLTDEQREEIAKGWRGRNWTVGDIIDAVEAAHGIKE